MDVSELKHFTLLGDPQEYDVLFTFDNDENGKSYIVFTDNKLDEDGKTCVYASIFDPDADVVELTDIETDKEWDLVEKLLRKIEQEVKDSKCKGEITLHSEDLEETEDK